MEGEPAPKGWVGGLGAYGAFTRKHNVMGIGKRLTRRLSSLFYCAPSIDRDVYRIGLGPVVAHLDIQVDNRQAPVWNVIGLIEGSVEPDRYVILGNHRDGAYVPHTGVGAGDEQSI